MALGANTLGECLRAAVDGPAIETKDKSPSPSMEFMVHVLAIGLYPEANTSYPNLPKVFI